MYDRVHLLLKALLDSVPTLAPTLLAALDRFAPPKRHKREAQVSYFQNVLRVLDYCPQLCEDILQTVIGRAVKMDVSVHILSFVLSKLTSSLQVEIQVDVEEWEDEGGDLDREIFGYQVEDVLDQVPNEDDDASEADSDSDAGSDVASIDDLSDLEEAADDDDENDDAQNKAQDEDELDPKVVLKLQRTTAKLDAILKMLFSYLTQQDFQPKSSSSSSTRHSTPTGSRPTSPQRQSAQHSKDNLFEALLAIFDRTVLRAFKTRHTQFLLFWFASQHPDFADRFVGTLLHRVLHEADKPVLTRMASASYLASFLSRAKFIDSSTIKGAVGLLCEWLDDQLHLVSPSPTSSGFLPGPGRIRGSSSSLGPNQFAVFYSVTQALLYIFCYRWKDLLVEEEEDPDEDMLLNTLDGSTGRKWLPELHAIKKAITSSLNPLKASEPHFLTTDLTSD